MDTTAGSGTERRSAPRAILLATAVAAGALSVGALVAVHPAYGLAPATIVAAALVIRRRESAAGLWLGTLLVLLVGYALSGRGFAYLGVPPLFIGEAVLGLGLIMVPLYRRLKPQPIHYLIAVFMVWGALRTLPYLGAYGLDALRDGVMWIYASYALLVGMLLRTSHVETLIRTYRRFVPIALFWIPALAALWFAAPQVLPVVPGSGVPVPYFKAGDMAVHLAGISVFILAGLYGVTRRRRVVEPLAWTLWIAAFLAVAVTNRGGMLAAILASLSVLAFVRSFPRWLVAVLTGLTLFTAAATLNFEVDVGRDRALSVGQLVENLESVLGETDEPDLAGTREWRLEWWGEIVDYTVDGPHFWGGKGYGINLAEDDGFLGVAFPDLRSPHNAHLTFLARGGVPGLVLWGLVLTAFAVSMVRSALRAARAGRRGWLAVHAWIVAYWLAATVNMTFDVYLEGPQGGILFWSLVGAGTAVVRLSGKADCDLGLVLAEGARPESMRSAQNAAARP